MGQRMPPDVQCSFLHGPIDRAEAEQHLIRFADRDGWFLVRRKEGQRDTLVLSVVVAPRVEHHIITLPAYSIGPFQGEKVLTCLLLTNVLSFHSFWPQRAILCMFGHRQSLHS